MDNSNEITTWKPSVSPPKKKPQKPDFYLQGTAAWDEQNKLYQE